MTTDDDGQHGAPPSDADVAREQAEWEQLQREANAIDPEKYRKRGRIIGAVALGALGAGLVYVTLLFVDKARNPCERVRDYLCRRGAESPSCSAYDGIFRESVEESSREMRSTILSQCQIKIERLAEEGVKVP